jgi:hypothetical protein
MALPPKDIIYACTQKDGQILYETRGKDGDDSKATAKTDAGSALHPSGWLHKNQ